MKKITHIIFGLGATLYFISLYFPITYLHVITTIAYTTLPDIDIRFKHRRILHNVFSLAIATGILYYSISYLTINGVLQADPISISIAGFTGYATHLFLDSLTKRGIDILWPLSHKSIGVKTIRYDNPFWNTVISLIGIIFLILWLI